MEYESAIARTLTLARERYKQVESQGDGGRFLGLGASGDRTTVLDKELEDVVLKDFEERFGNCLIVSEEAGVIGDEGSRLTLLVDPLDGSTNATRGIPMFSTSMAVAEGKCFEDIVAAGVIDLVNGDVITASKGKGCRLNGRTCGPSKVVNLREAVVCLDLGTKGSPASDTTLAGRLISAIRYPRSLGTAALETAYVAIGRVDGYAEPVGKLRTYDCLPSLFMVKEAGCFYEFLGRRSGDFNLVGPFGVGYVAACTRELLALLSALVHGER